MSIARNVKVNFNLDRLEEAAQRLGFKTMRNAIALGYWTEGMNNNQNFPLVIKGKNGRFDIGVTEDELVTDMHGGYVQRDLNQILPAYYSAAAEGAGFSVMDKTETNQEIVLRIGR